MTKHHLWVIAGASLVAGIAWATDWSGAKSKAEQQCPEIDDDLRLREVSASWRESCC